MNTSINIRVASINDAQDLLKIYSPYVEKTSITFEYEVPSLEEFQNRIKTTLEKYPYLVAESEGKIVGYAYAGPFKTRAAYGWDVEVSVYVDKNFHGNGCGRLLYEKLESFLKKMNITNMNACITYSEVEDEYLTHGSPNFHKKMGFSLVGKFNQCGYKFNRWYDMIWMEKMIGEHKQKMPAVKPFFEVL